MALQIANLFPFNWLDHSSIKLSSQKRFIKLLKMDIAPTSNGKCFGCRKKIIKDSPRSWTWSRFQRTNKKERILNIKRLYCYKCTLIKINYEIECLNSELKLDKMLLKRFKRTASGKKASAALINQDLINTLLQENNVTKGF